MFRHWAAASTGFSAVQNDARNLYANNQSNPYDVGALSVFFVLVWLIHGVIYLLCFKAHGGSAVEGFLVAAGPAVLAFLAQLDEHGFFSDHWFAGISLGLLGFALPYLGFAHLFFGTKNKKPGIPGPRGWGYAIVPGMAGRVGTMRALGPLLFGFPWLGAVLAVYFALRAVYRRWESRGPTDNAAEAIRYKRRVAEMENLDLWTAIHLLGIRPEEGGQVSYSLSFIGPTLLMGKEDFILP